EFNRVNEATIKDGRWRAVLVKTDQDREVTLYMQPQTPGVMPSGPLQVGKQYTFTGELKSNGQFTTDQGVLQGNPGLWLFSYDALQQRGTVRRRTHCVAGPPRIPWERLQPRPLHRRRKIAPQARR